MRTIKIKQSFLSIALCSFTVSSVASTSISAADPSFQQRASSTARSGAVGATTNSHSSYFWNPATNAFFNKYSVALNYSQSTSNIQAQIIDATTNPAFGGGMFYQQRKVEEVDWSQDTSLGTYNRSEKSYGTTMFSKLGNKMGLGLTVKYLQINPEKNSGFKKENYWNADFGVIYKLTQEISLGASALDFLSNSKNPSPKRYVFSSEFRPGPHFALSAQLEHYNELKEDSLFNFQQESSLSWAASAQYTYNKRMSLSAGYRKHGPWNQTRYSAGITYHGQKLSAGYAIQGNLTAETKEEKKAQHHNFDVALTF